MFKNDIAKSRKSFNQANQGSDNVADLGVRKGKHHHTRSPQTESEPAPVAFF